MKLLLLSTLFELNERSVGKSKRNANEWNLVEETHFTEKLEDLQLYTQNRNRK